MIKETLQIVLYVAIYCAPLIFVIVNYFRNKRLVLAKKRYFKGAPALKRSFHERLIVFLRMTPVIFMYPGSSTAMLRPFDPYINSAHLRGKPIRNFLYKLLVMVIFMAVIVSYVLIVQIYVPLTILLPTALICSPYLTITIISIILPDTTDKMYKSLDSVLKNESKKRKDYYKKHKYR